jgi:hypothetical protein
VANPLPSFPPAPLLSVFSGSTSTQGFLGGESRVYCISRLQSIHFRIRMRTKEIHIFQQKWLYVQSATIVGIVTLHSFLMFVDVQRTERKGLIIYFVRMGRCWSVRRIRPNPSTRWWPSAGAAGRSSGQTSVHSLGTLWRININKKHGNGHTGMK